MSRRVYIQRSALVMLAVQLLRGEKGSVPRAIQWAESLADQVQAAGYGWTREQATRESVDYVARMSEAQRAGFDSFWSAWRPSVGATGGKMRAAKVWAELDLSADLVRARVLPAAAADAARPRGDSDKRAWAERWLRERRWEDAAVATAARDGNTARVRELRQELVGLAKAAALGIDGTEPRAAALRAELESLEGQH